MAFEERKRINSQQFIKLTELNLNIINQEITQCNLIYLKVDHSIDGRLLAKSHKEKTRVRVEKLEFWKKKASVLGDLY